MSKIFVFINTTEEHINQFEIGFITNPTLHVNKVFRDQYRKFLKYKYHQSIMKRLKNVLRKKYTCVIALVMFYETKNPQQKCIGC